MRNNANLEMRAVKGGINVGSGGLFNGHSTLTRNDAPKTIPNKNARFCTPRVSTGQNIFRLQTKVDLQYESVSEEGCSVPYRDAVCTLCEKTVSLALSVPLIRMQSKTRSSAEVALARQIAMYLSHTMFSILLTEVGLHFKRDRTTVSYACALVEDKRDDPTFDLMIGQLESLLLDARLAMSICVEHDPVGFNAADNHKEVKTPGAPTKCIVTRVDQ